MSIEDNFFLIEEDKLMMILEKACQWEIYQETKNELIPAARDKEVEKRIKNFLKDYETINIDFEDKKGNKGVG